MPGHPPVDMVEEGDTNREAHVQRNFISWLGKNR